MKCFYHPDRDAIGACKSCGKGLCPHCAADLGDGLACRDRCERKVRDINRLIETHIRLARSTPRLLAASRYNLTNTGVFFLAIAVLFGVGALLMDNAIIGYLTALLAVLFALYGVLNMIRGFAMPADDADTPESEDP